MVHSNPNNVKIIELINSKDVSCEQNLIISISLSFGSNFTTTNEFYEPVSVFVIISVKVLQIFVWCENYKNKQTNKL